MKMDVFWVVAPCSLGEFTNVSELLAASIITAIDYTVQQPRRQLSY
jgi:hypothetical protein